jgi:glycosyltransferase involved in cell wall biosynthesis
LNLRRGSRRIASPLLKAADVLGAACLFLLLALRIALRVASGRRRSYVSGERKLLVLDMSYTLEEVRKRQLQEPITARDLGGFFSHVWSVHPCATINSPATQRDTFGAFIVIPLADRHTVVEGKVGRFPRLRLFPTVNFLFAQYELLRYLDRLIAREGISAVRAGDPYYLGLLALALSRIHRIPCVFRIPMNYDTFYTHVGHLAYPRLFRRRWIEQLISHVTLRRADLVAGSNQDSLNFALDNGARREYSTLFRVGNLIHQAHFQPPDQRPPAEPALRELGLCGIIFSMTMCRLEPLKHVDDVLYALREVRSEGIDLHALIVGDGRLKEELLGLARSLGVADQVVFAGNRSQEWIATVLPHAAVVLSPHMGRGLTEALLGGVAAVAYDVEWQSEIVISGKTGELVDYRNWKEMFRAIRRLCADPGYAKQLGENARAFTLKMMDPDTLSQHERTEYLKLLARARPGAPAERAS